MVVQLNILAEEKNTWPPIHHALSCLRYLAIDGDHNIKHTTVAIRQFYCIYFLEIGVWCGK